MAIIHGRNLILKIGNAAIAGAKSCELTVNCDEIEISSPNSSQWRDFVAGRKYWEVTCNHLVVTTSSSLPVKSNTAMVGSKVTLSFDSGQTGDTISGQALVRTWKVTATVGNLAQGSFVFRGCGSLE